MYNVLSVTKALNMYGRKSNAANHFAALLMVATECYTIEGRECTPLLLLAAGTTLTTLGALATGTCGTLLIAFGLLDEYAV